MKHARDIRLMNNGGITVAVCVADREGPLDLDAQENTECATGGRRSLDGVDCPDCLRIWPERYPWAAR